MYRRSDELPLMDLTIPQLRTLLLIHELGPRRMSEIGLQMGVGMPTVTSPVGKSEEKEMVRREHGTQDRRVVSCSATDYGRTEVGQVLAMKAILRA